MSIQRYVEQLIDDIRLAANDLDRKDSQLEEVLGQFDENDFLDDEEDDYFEEDLFPISEITGIEQMYLPPPEKLNNEQCEKLSGELKKLLYVYNLRLKFPGSLPYKERYSLIYKIWEEEYPVIPDDEWVDISFCRREKHSCPLSELCSSCDENEKDASDHSNKQDDIAENTINDLLTDDEKVLDFLKNKELYEDDDDEGAFFEKINGFYSDNTNKNIDETPLPKLCQACRKNYLENSEVHLFCSMKRNNHSKGKNFDCGNFEKSK